MSEMRAKMRVVQLEWTDESKENMRYFTAVTTDEQPGAKVSTMTVLNPTLFGEFKEGDEFYVDFTKVDVLADADTNAETGS